MSKGLDKFYTKEAAVRRLIGMLDLDDYHIIVEPSAGDGAFVRQLKLLGCKVAALDIDPDHPNTEDIKKMDFFDFKIGTKDESKKDSNILTIGNPPFGKNSSLAIKFFNYAATFSSCIAFVVPRTFRKSSVQNKLDLNFHLQEECVLPRDSFYLPTGEDYEVPTVAQVWVKKDIKRNKVKLLTKHKDFDFLGSSDFSSDNINLKFSSPSYYGDDTTDSYEMTKKEYEAIQSLRKKFPKLFSCHRVITAKKDLEWNNPPDFAFRRAGSRAGEIFEDYSKCPTQGFDFIKAKDDKVVSVFREMWKTKWSPDNEDRDAEKWDTAGQPSISKHELITFYNETKTKMENDK